MNTFTQADDTAHPTLAEIDAARSSEASPDIAAHIRDCSQCTAVLAQLQVLGGQARVVRIGPYPEASDADDAVFATIERRSVEIRRQRRGRRILTHPVWAAAAAVLLVALSTLVISPIRQMVWNHDRLSLATDMDRDGTTDIVDAYLLALAVRGERPTSNSWDLTGDEVVDDADVRAVARMAVSVGRSAT